MKLLSKEHMELAAKQCDKKPDEIEIFANHLKLKAFFKDIDFNQMFKGTYGMVQKSMDDCLGKKIIHRVDGTIVVIK